MHFHRNIEATKWNREKIEKEREWDLLKNGKTQHTMYAHEKV